MSGLAINKEAYRIVYWQLILVAGLAVLLFLLQGLRSGLSALLGGLAYWLPTFLFVWRVFARTSPRAAKQFLLLFIMGETAKLLLSAVLFLLILKFLPVNFLSVLIGFVGAIMAFWVSSLFLFARSEGVRQ